MNFFYSILGCLIGIMGMGYGEMIPLKVQNRELNGERCKVGVIGGGISGLTAAYRLHQWGYDVTLFEAQERLGGRIFTEKLPNSVLEFGGENIADGGEAPFIRALVKEFNLELEEKKLSQKLGVISQEGIILDQDLYKGKFTPSELSERLESLQKTCFTMDEILLNLFPDQGLEYQTLSNKLGAYEGGPSTQLSTCYIDTLYAMLMGGLSAVHALEEAETWIDFIRIKGGNNILIHRLGEALEERVRLEMPLKGVYTGKERKYSLLFDQESIEVDILILAIPCLLYKEIAFEKGIIPQERLEMIHQVQYGTNAKILIPLDFLPKNPIKLIYSDAISYILPGQTAMTLYLTGKEGIFETSEVGQILDRYAPILKEYGFQEDVVPLARTYCWANNPFIRGSYSFIGVGQEKIWDETEVFEREKIRSLFSPISNSLYFAGEHTALQEPLGTMEGACASGERVATWVKSQSEPLQ